MKTKTIQWNLNQSYGGYLQYWKLYGKMLKQISDKSTMMQSIMQQIAIAEKITGEKLAKKTKIALFKLRLQTYTTTFVWACIIKPLGQFFPKRVTIQGSYYVKNDQFVNKDLKKSTTYKFIGIPYWKADNQKLTEEETKELIK